MFKNVVVVGVGLFASAVVIKMARTNRSCGDAADSTNESMVMNWALSVKACW